ncbi:hypothetical protein [Shinella sp.]|uniref:hypothetical protein n=1 Tax=Shinella sp. TaxID=1870904 RepID=UPI00289D7829|nr:hypothetical protein [Shinella sp.]
MDALDECALVARRFDDRAERNVLHAPQHDLRAFGHFEGFHDAAKGQFHAAVMQVMVGGVESFHGQTISP